MAKAPAKTKTPGTEIVDWEAEMAAQAQLAAEAQRSAGGGGKFFSLKSGVLSFDGNPMPGNQMAVVVLANINENSWYEGAYDPNTPAAPKCFAFGQHEEAHGAARQGRSTTTTSSASTASATDARATNGAAPPPARARTVRTWYASRIIPAGQYKAKGSGRNQTFELELYDDEAHFAKAEPAYLKVPVMSVKHWTKYVKQLAADIGRPPHGVMTNVYIEPDAKSQFAVKFELIDRIDNDLLGTIVSRHKAEQANIDFPYSPPMEEDEKPAPAKANNKLRGKGKK
jgi:hypothetical protein